MVIQVAAFLGILDSVVKARVDIRGSADSVGIADFAGCLVIADTPGSLGIQGSVQLAGIVVSVELQDTPGSAVYLAIVASVG